MTQREMILKHLKRYGKITDVQAFNNFGIRRLGARVFELREQGYPILTKMTTKPNRYGKNVSFATYILEGDKK